MTYLVKFLKPAYFDGAEELKEMHVEARNERAAAWQVKRCVEDATHLFVYPLALKFEIPKDWGKARRNGGDSPPLEPEVINQGKPSYAAYLQELRGRTRPRGDER